ncbi:MAG: FAD-binding oxidoreductase [Chloroflexota bacterium]
METPLSLVASTLRAIVGEQYVSDDIVVRQCYNRDPHPSVTVRKRRKDPLTIPDLVVLPQSTEEVQAIMRTAGRYRFNVIPMGSGDNLTGCCIPTRQRTIILDLKRMDRILEINTEKSYIRMQPWVSFARVQAETMKRGLWNGGTPAAPASNSIVSNCLTYGGAWQTAQAFGMGVRSFLGLTIVLPGGDILRTGSHGIKPGDATYWYGPGPDLRALWEMGALGGLGIVTEVLFKLHTWPGGEWPQEADAGHAPLPVNHRIFWYRFDTPEDCMRAGHEIAYAGIGIGTNIPINAVNAMVGESHLADTMQRWQEGFYEPLWMYVMCAGYSPGQLDYEEKVLRDIMAECRGQELSEEKLRHLENYRCDCFRAGDFVRWIKCGIYAITYLGRGPISDMARIHQWHMHKVHQYKLPPLNESWPFYYAYDRGHFWMEERDLFGDQLEDAALISKIVTEVYRESDKQLSGYWLLREPLPAWFGEKIGPNFDRLLKLIKGIFDPDDIANPDRLVFMRPREKSREKGSDGE